MQLSHWPWIIHDPPVGQLQLPCIALHIIMIVFFYNGPLCQPFDHSQHACIVKYVSNELTLHQLSCALQLQLAIIVPFWIHHFPRFLPQVPMQSLHLVLTFRVKIFLVDFNCFWEPRTACNQRGVLGHAGWARIEQHTKGGAWVKITDLAVLGWSRAIADLGL